MKQLLCVLLWLPILAIAQEKGIHFEEGLTWEQVLAKARAQNKFIFVDCYATWCQPCKVMDQKVYPDDSLGLYMNEKFISVKVQMDTTKSDREQVKLLRPAARLFEKEYTINSLPTYLFFAPDGKVVHKQAGVQSIGLFKLLADDARTPEKQYYTKIENWKTGKMSHKNLLALATEVKYNHNDIELAGKMAKDYKTNYLDKLNEKELLTTDNLNFLVRFPETVTLKDKAFDLVYNRPAKVNSVMKDTNFARNLLISIAHRNLVDPALAKANMEAKEPDWKKIEARIDKHFGNGLSEQIMNTAKYNWYESRNDHANRVKYLVKSVDRMGINVFNTPMAFLSLNNNAWEVFLHSTNKQELEKALSWIDYVLSREKDSKETDVIATYMDTRANILYKLNRKTEALNLETEAFSLSNSENHKVTLEKMRKDEPTWVVSK
jgi:thioredoxin-related protein